MINLIFKAVLVLLLMLGLNQTNTFAQTITAGPDSTVIRSSGDSIRTGFKGWSEPGKAAFMSAILPGLGQAYNKSYWKIPLVYAAIGGCLYAISINHDNYLNYRQAIRVRSDLDSLNNVDRFTSRIGTFALDTQLNQLRRGRDNFRRWRDLSMLYTILAYALNVTEAYVHAHLKGFDVSDDLAFQFTPDLIRTHSNKYTPALSLSINLKK